MLADAKPFRSLISPRRAATDDLRDALLELAHGQATILAHAEKSWASVTFAGARHRLELLFDGEEAIEAGELFIALLPEHEFDIPGQLVADATVTEVDHRLQPQRMQVSCELLLLDEA
jgi:hypothetical protein